MGPIVACDPLSRNRPPTYLRERGVISISTVPDLVAAELGNHPDGIRSKDIAIRVRARMIEAGRVNGCGMDMIRLRVFDRLHHLLLQGLARRHDGLWFPPP